MSRAYRSVWIVCHVLVAAAVVACSSKGRDSAPSAGGGSTSNQPQAGSTNFGGGGVAAGGQATGGGGASAAGGGTEAVGGTTACPVDPNLITHGGWVGCDPASADDNPQGLQGSFYMFGDGSSCPQVESPCGASGCCIAGATTVDATYAAWGCGLGLELNSSGGPSSVKSAYAGPVKCFDIGLAGSSGGNLLRISYTQDADMTGKVAPFVELDPISDGWSGTICFEDAQCPNWMPAPDCATGSQYDLQIQVVGAVQAGAFDLCLTSLVAHDGSGAGLTTLKQMCEDLEETSGSGYLFRNNVWNEAGGEQCVTAKAGGGQAALIVDSANHNVGSGEPAAYPSIVKGWHWGLWTPDSGMPKAIAGLTSTVTADVTVPSSGGRFNTAFDLWVHPDTNPATPGGGLEIMIWLNSREAQPLGGPVGNVSIGNATWDVWSGSIEDWQYLAYVRQGGGNTFSGDLAPFLADAVTRGQAEDTWNLLSIQFGFEIWQSASPFAINAFSAVVN
ncbi:MAG TPA: hypothetical protein VM686_14705 [Polyangiaceae bacterium]|nr:hypothetical protein [Polyangiaceae bacterium]